MERSQAQTLCPAAQTLTLLSKRHMLLIIYTLVDAPMGFNELQEATAVNTATLTSRLQELESNGIILKKACKKDCRHQYYSLAERGLKLSKLIAKFSNI